MILITGISLYTVRIVIDVLGVVDYGIYGLLVSTILIFGFLKNTLILSVQRYHSFELGVQNSTKLKAIFSSALIIHLCLAVLIFIIGETVGIFIVRENLNIPMERLNSAIWAYHFALLTSLIAIIQVPFNAVIISHEKMNFYAIIGVIEVVLKLLAVYLLYVLSFDALILYSSLIFLVSFLVLICYYLFAIKHFEEVSTKFVFDKETLKSLLNFSGWNSISSMGTLISRDGIAILLSVFFGPIAVAARTISLQISKGLNQFIFGLQSAINPQIVKLYSSNLQSEMIILIIRNAKFAFLLLWILSLPILINLDYILNLWLTKVPDHTYEFCLLSFTHALITCFRRPFIMALQSTGEIKFVSIKTGLIMCSVIPSSYIFFKLEYPIYTPLIIHIIAVLICFAIELSLLTKLIDISFDLIVASAKKLFVVVIISLIISYVIKLNLVDINFYVFLTTTLLSVFMICVITYFLIMDKWEKSKIISLKSNLILTLTKLIK